MRIQLLIILLFSFTTCSKSKTESASDSLSNVNEELGDTNFKLIEDFEINKSTFKQDTLSLMEQSAEGGEVIVFRNKGGNYSVVDIWIYGEMGKLHAICWVNKQNDLIFVKRTNYDYDMPASESGHSTRETIEYFSFTDNGFRFYNSDQMEISESRKEKEAEVVELFNAVTTEIGMVK
ncbi:MAG: hypothetical protein SH819_06050 [Cytophagales bacterium]|nr:hypothetical protein [Cytophagales bacterium]